MEADPLAPVIMIVLALTITARARAKVRVLGIDEENLGKIG